MTKKHAKLGSTIHLPIRASSAAVLRHRQLDLEFQQLKLEESETGSFKQLP